MGIQKRENQKFTNQILINLSSIIAPFVAVAIIGQSSGSLALPACSLPRSSHVFSGGDRTDPVHISHKILKQLEGRWVISSDGQQVVDIEILKDSAQANSEHPAVRLSYHEFNPETQTWVTLTTKKVSYIEGKVVFTLPAQAPGQTNIIVLSGYAQGKDDRSTVKILAEHKVCGPNGELIDLAHSGSLPLWLVIRLR